MHSHFDEKCCDAKGPSLGHVIDWIADAFDVFAVFAEVEGDLASQQRWTEAARLARSTRHLARGDREGHPA